MFTDKLKEVIRLGLRKRCQFAVYFLPDETKPHVVVSSRLMHGYDGQCNGFIINSFGNEYGEPLFIPEQFSVDDALNYLGTVAEGSEPEMEPYNVSTEKKDYLAKIAHVIKNLSFDGGKIVLSRVICGDFWSKDHIEVIKKYFEAFPSTFRYVYYTPKTGAWFGASPEVLLCRHSETDVVKTMALAGTRKLGEGDWDAKNVEEHDFVTQYIVSVLADAGLNPIVGDSESVKFGSIEHLCHRIEANFSGNIADIVNKLSPTPALAGFPLAKALSVILQTESHPRHCYGGYVGCKNESGEFVYVNLRCVHFSLSSFCIYAGGGITGKSDPETEWNETEAKSAYLRKALDC